jgi:DNA-binding PucR family transcriptional regulator
MPDVKAMLEELARSAHLRPFRELLEPLAAHDAERGSDLVRTLTVFFDCGENTSEAADRLFLHRNSVTYRLARIEKLTGVHLKDHRSRIALELGLLALAQDQERGRNDQDKRPQPDARHRNRGGQG